MNASTPRPRPPGATRPFVLVNMAMSADGKIATANRAVTTFGSPRDLAHLYELRATADAILSGARTIEDTGATLGPGGARYQRQRRRHGLAEFPLRIIASGRASIDPASPIFHRGQAPIVLLTTRRAPAARLRRLAPHLAGVIARGGDSIDFPAALAELRRAWGVRRLLCEGGGELNDALFRAGLVDELNLTVCPVLIGGREAPTLADGAGCARLADAAAFRLHRARRVGDEMFFTWRAARR
ncbi:MAG: hypothetical protein RJA22_974 [Verrucomicrobiota bacterium]|jgi:riboflavin-specific deaminase-like protein